MRKFSYNLAQFKWFGLRMLFILAYILVAGWEYNFGAMYYGGWFFFHLDKLMVYLAATCIVFYAVRRFTHVNPRVFVLVMDVLLLPFVYLYFES